jgi:hypothetical protein
VATFDVSDESAGKSLVSKRYTFPPLQSIVFTGVTFMNDGAEGIVVILFESMAALAMLFPQLEVKDTLTLSPIEAAILFGYITLIVCEFISPESITAVAPSAPVNDHNHPFAEATFEVSDEAYVRPEALYLYNFPLHTFVFTGVMSMLVGAAGTAVTVLVSLIDFAAVLPQSVV